MSRVVVGMSGGVDSSVAAKILKDQGHEVIGLFMRNWHEEDPSGHCTADEDYADVKKVCAKLGIAYYPVDFSKEYEQRVFTHFLQEYRKGRTPNPDVLCNREIKFDVFLKYAFEVGADYVATGHYCRIKRENGKTYLCKAADQNKDQTYFLCQVPSKQLERVIFPVGDLMKDEVRSIALQAGIPTAQKKDSTGICFIGERKFREFLSQYIPMKEGDIVCDGECVGRHKGVFYYTIGQRRGLGLGGAGARWFVVGKDVEKNILYVKRGEENEDKRTEVTVEDFVFITDKKEGAFPCTVRVRHRQEEQQAQAFVSANNNIRIQFNHPQRGIAAGQYAVLYDGEICLGGGVIEG